MTESSKEDKKEIAKLKEENEKNINIINSLKEKKK